MFADRGRAPPCPLILLFLPMQSLVLAPLFVWFELLWRLGYRRGLRAEVEALVQVGPISVRMVCCLRVETIWIAGV